MNNLPNIKRKGRNVHSFLAFFTIRMLVIIALLHTGTRKEKHYAGCQE